MTTITIKEDQQLSKKTFNTVNEMLTYFATKENSILLTKLKKSELTPKRIKDFDEVEKKTKADFIDLQ